MERLFNERAASVEAQKEGQKKQRELLCQRQQDQRKKATKSRQKGDVHAEATRINAKGATSTSKAARSTQEKKNLKRGQLRNRRNNTVLGEHLYAGSRSSPLDTTNAQTLLFTLSYSFSFPSRPK